MSDQQDPPALNAGPATTAEQDAMLDTLDELLPPASTAHGDTDISRVSARRIQAVRLRMSGATYEQIAQQCGYSDKSAARHAVTRALARIEVESITELRTLENARLDADELVLRTLISDPSKKPGDRIRAIDSRLRLSARRARLNGLDAPIQVALSAGVQADLADALAEVESVLGEVLSVETERQEG